MSEEIKCREATEEEFKKIEESGKEIPKGQEQADVEGQQAAYWTTCSVCGVTDYWSFLPEVFYCSRFGHRNVRLY